VRDFAFLEDLRSSDHPVNDTSPPVQEGLIGAVENLAQTLVADHANHLACEIKFIVEIHFEQVLPVNLSQFGHRLSVPDGLPCRGNVGAYDEQILVNTPNEPLSSAALVDLARSAPDCSEDARGGPFAT
jgi:hypothetical protein